MLTPSITHVLEQIWNYDDVYTIGQRKLATHPYQVAWHDISSAPVSNPNRCDGVDMIGLNTSHYKYCKTELQQLPTVIDTTAYFDCAFTHFLVDLAWTANSVNERCTVCYIRGLPIHGLGIVDYCLHDSVSTHLTTHSLMILSKKPLRNIRKKKFQSNPR